jgi:DNA-binding NtrC family response regulator
MVQSRDGSVVVPLALGAALVVGRSSPSDVIVDDTSLSRQHARFVGAPGGASVEDLGSTNGTTVGGEAVEQAELVHGDKVELGAVTVTILSASELDVRNVAPHDRFRTWLDEELERARFFKRSVALFMVRLSDRSGVPHNEMLDLLRTFLRPIDRVGQYAGGVIEVLAPEQSAADVRARLLAGRKQTTEDKSFVSGIAAFPDAGASSEELLGGAWQALRRASASNPIVLAADGEQRGVREPRGEAPKSGALSKAMQGVLATAARVARTTVPVLILGETGTGKEVLARTVHESSARREGPFICVNCGAIPAPLVESILFGHERGAFTGANQRTQGVFEAASGGTVFFDEIGELPLPVQAVLLRVLETKTFTRVGSTKEVTSDTRIVAATHRNLDSMVDAGTFRQDLLYRLNAVTLELPPLRERREDIAGLARELLAQAAAGMDAPPVIEPGAMEVLETYAWPGNIRELRNVLERAVAVAEGPAIGVDELPERMRSLRSSVLAEGSVPPEAAVIDLGRMPADYRTAMESLEAEYLRYALQRENWNQTHTARSLGMALRTLVHKIKVLGVRRPDKT